MRKNDKNKQIIYKLMKELNICDIIIMKVLNNYTIKIYRIGFNDAFNWKNQKNNKNNSRGCITAVQPLKSKE